MFRKGQQRHIFIEHETHVAYVLEIVDYTQVVYKYYSRIKQRWMYKVDHEYTFLSRLKIAKKQEGKESAN